jgi:hypothetical protein
MHAPVEHALLSLLGQSHSSRRSPAKTAYKNFFTLWKEADPDIPILKQAKAEYAKLE